MDTMSYATNESRDNICNLMDLINLITYCCLVLLPSLQDWSSFEDMGPWADPHTRCYSAGRDWSQGSWSASRSGTTRKDPTENSTTSGWDKWVAGKPNCHL